MLNNNVPLFVVSKILGHASPSTTINLYGHLITKGQLEAVRVIEEVATPIPVALDPSEKVAHLHEKTHL